VGNLPIELASKKPLSKELQRHILAFVPTAKIESVRFRSIPFQTPTYKLPTSDDEGDDIKTKLKPQAPKKGARPHDREHASVWRSKAVDKDEAVVKQDEKKYITAGQKKKIAFINQEFHSTADTINAYIVFAHPINTPPPVLTPHHSDSSALDGTCMREHGVGIGKREYLVEDLREGTVKLMIKKTVDPLGLFNPGKLYPDISESKSAKK